MELNLLELDEHDRDSLEKDIEEFYQATKKFYRKWKKVIDANDEESPKWLVEMRKIMNLRLELLKEG